MQRSAAACHTQVEVWIGILQGRTRVSDYRQEPPELLGNEDSEVQRRHSRSITRKDEPGTRESRLPAATFCAVWDQLLDSYLFCNRDCGRLRRLNLTAHCRCTQAATKDSKGIMLAAHVQNSATTMTAGYSG